MTGRFISIEGIEGAGKTTQCDLLCSALGDAGVDCHRTREPGGSHGAEAIRRLFLEHEWDGVAESFLLMAARRDHVMSVICPTLVAGRWVVSDRFSLTTLVYQGCGRGVDVSLLEDMDEAATDHFGTRGYSFMPDLTIVLDVPADVGLTRARNRSAPDRMERLPVEFFERVRSGFLRLALTHSSKCIVIDGTRLPSEVHADIRAVLLERLGVAL